MRRTKIISVARQRNAIGEHSRKSYKNFGQFCPFSIVMIFYWGRGAWLPCGASVLLAYIRVMFNSCFHEKSVEILQSGRVYEEKHFFLPEHSDIDTLIHDVV